jgi:uncharacterized protein YdaU (DUF1376 family)
MDWYYSEERQIPHDKRYTIGRCQSARERSAVDFVLNEYFRRDGDTWIHDRIEREIAKSAPKIDAARENGKRGGRPRKVKPSGFVENNPVGFSNETQNEPSAKAPQSPISNQEQKPTSLERQAARKTADRFEEFWAAYPVKKGRAEAEAKWRAKGYDAMAGTIIADVKRRIAEDRQWRDGYIPHGSTYVNGRGWEDAVESVRDANGGLRSVAPSGTQRGGESLDDLMARAI